jgi:hypothetical protein
LYMALTDHSPVRDNGGKVTFIVVVHAVVGLGDKPVLLPVSSDRGYPTNGLPEV